MKSLTRSLLLALVLTTGARVPVQALPISTGSWEPLNTGAREPVQAQTFEQSLAAYKRKDYRTAFAGFKRLAEQGHARAQFSLGVIYADGQGVPKDEQQEMAWYRKAAEQGDAVAQFNLGLMYADGQGVPKDQQQAVVWYRKAAEKGHAGAQSNLGAMYDRCRTTN